MMKQKLLILICLLIITHNCLCQMGPTLGGFSGSKDNYKVSSLFFSVINETITTINIVNFNKFGKLKSDAGFGIVTGLSQISYGLIFKDNCPKTYRNAFVILNVGIGTLAILTSSLRLLKIEQKKTNMTYWNLFYTPIKIDNFGVGITMTKKI